MKKLFLILVFVFMFPVMSFTKGVFNFNNWITIGEPGIYVSSTSLSKYAMFLNAVTEYERKSKQSLPTANYDSTFPTIDADGTPITYGTDEYAKILDGQRILTFGGFTQLIPKSQDTSAWTGSGPWTQSINLADTGTYTISTDLSGATVTITAGTATIDAGASATYGVPDQFVVTGAGTVTISTDTANPRVQLTKTAYRMPYALNSTTGALVIAARYSDDNTGDPFGPRLAIADMPLVLDALDGVADGVELAPNYSCDDTTNITSGGGVLTSVGGELSFNVTADNANRVYQVITVTPGNTYEFSWVARIGTLSGDLKYSVYNQTVSTEFIPQTVYTAGNKKIRFAAPAGCTTVRCYVVRDATGVGTCFFDNFSVKEISPAQGEIEFSWTPKFNAADVTGNINIISANATVAGLIYYDKTAGKLKVTDGTNTAEIACTPVSGTEMDIKLQWGVLSGQQMRLVLDGTPGTAAAHVGRFPYITNFMEGYQAAPGQGIGDIKIRKVPTW